MSANSNLLIGKHTVTWSSAVHLGEFKVNPPDEFALI